MTTKFNNITSKETNFTEWYLSLIKQANLVVYGPIKGTMFLTPYCYSIWNNIQKLLDEKFAELNVQNMSAPLLLPASLLEKEKKHIAGFLPETPIIKEVGGEKLDEPIIIRPTSEVLFCNYFKDQLTSYKQLPLLVNQWANIVRWEKNTKVFLRSREFYWQEGHTIHIDDTSAKSFTKSIWNLYQNVFHDNLSLSFFAGKKTDDEKFAGAVDTYTVEIMGNDGQCLQTATSHYLATNFSKPFDITFLSKNNKKEFPEQTSWGTSTRLLGALIFTHSDNKGINLPSSIAPYQIVIVPILNNKNDKQIIKACEVLKKTLKDYRIFIDNSEKSFGFKAQEWEVKGVPIRIDLGIKDIEKKSVKVVCRLSDKPEFIKTKDIKKQIINLLETHDKTLLNSSQSNQKKLVEFPKSKNEFIDAIKNNKGAIINFCNDINLIKEIKKLTGASTRCILKENINGAKCIWSGKEATDQIFFARSY